MVDMGPKRLRDVDHGWAWMVMVAACLTQLLLGMVHYSYGVIQIVLLDTFQQGLVDTTWILSIAASLISFPGPWVGILTNLTSCRTTMLIGTTFMFVGLVTSAFATSLDHLYVTLALLTGLGSGIVYTPNLVVIGFYFDRHLDIATGFVVTGGAIGMMAGPPLTSYICDTYGWRGMFILLAGITSNMFVCSLACSPSVVERGYSSERHGHASSRTSLANAKPSTRIERSWSTSMLRKAKDCGKVVFSFPMLTFCSSVFLWSITVAIVTLFLPSFTVEIGATTSQSSLLFTVMGICNVVSRSISGVAINSRIIDKYLVYCGSFGIMSVLTIAFPFVPNTFPASLAYAGLFGFCTGGPYVVLTTITKDIAGLHYLAIAYGVELLVSGTGFMLGPPIAGWLVEATGSYTWSFVFGGLTCLVNSFLGMMLMICHKPGETKLEMEIAPSMSILNSRWRVGSQNLTGSGSRLGSLLRMASLGASHSSLTGIKPYIEHTASQFLHTHPQYVSDSTLDHEATQMMPSRGIVQTDIEEVDVSELSNQKSTS